MEVEFIQKLDSCDDCVFYRYIRCYGSDCVHPSVPDERGDEPLAENREGDFPKWCPFLRDAKMEAKR